MKTALKIVLGVLGVLVLLGAAGYVWAATSANAALARTFETHRVEIPIPFPLTDEERAALAPDEDPDAVALASAIERGRHLLEARYGCRECHGANFGGGVMIDDPMLGTALGPNLTLGRGSVTASYTAADWDRAVRHGIAPDGTPMVMPAVDFQLMSDQELSDIVAYVRTQPPVDNDVPPARLGPLGRVLLATGALPLSAELIPSHASAHASVPPTTEVSVEFGRHLAGVCSGCHGPTFAGGPIPGGDPSWAPAKNLTPHADALGPWTYGDFVRALREGRRPDGTALLEPMTFVLPAGQSMSDVELEALWTYLRSLPEVAPTE